MNINKKLIGIIVIPFVLLGILVFSFHQMWNDDTGNKSQIKISTNKEDSADSNEDYIAKRNKSVKDVANLKTIEAKGKQYQEINKYLKKQKFNGTIAVFKDGKLVMNKGYGYQDFEHKIKSSPNTMYLIGSAQKFTTGLMLKQLELEHKININAPVSKYLPWFKTSKKITLKDLELHKSGLYKFQASPSYETLDDAVHAIQEKGMDPNGYHKHLYNDGNYLVLAKVIEEVTHKPYAQNYYERLGKPLKLNNSAFFNEKPFQQHMAIGYYYKNNNIISAKPNTLQEYYGAGNLFMTTKDMGVLLEKLINNKIFDQSVTNPFIHEFGTKRYPTNYRYGFYTFPKYNRVSGMFNGQNFTGFSNGKYTVVLGTNKILSNTTNNEYKITHIFQNILKQNYDINVYGKKFY